MAANPARGQMNRKKIDMKGYRYFCCRLSETNKQYTYMSANLVGIGPVASVSIIGAASGAGLHSRRYGRTICLQSVGFGVHFQSYRFGRS